MSPEILDKLDKISIILEGLALAIEAQNKLISRWEERLETLEKLQRQPNVD